MDLRAQIPSPLPLGQLPAALSGDSVVVEEKVDGHRLVAVCLDGQVDARNRRGQHYKARPLPTAPRRALQAVPGPAVLDGELADNHFHVFDLRADASGDLTAVPWHQRRLRLEKLVADAGWNTDGGPVRLVPVARTRVERLELAAQVLARGGEGVVLKHVEGLYRPGRAGDWRKAKYSRTLARLCSAPDVQAKSMWASTLATASSDRWDPRPASAPPP